MARLKHWAPHPRLFQTSATHSQAPEGDSSTSIVSIERNCGGCVCMADETSEYLAVIHHKRGGGGAKTTNDGPHRQSY